MDITLQPLTKLKWNWFRTYKTSKFNWTRDEINIHLQFIFHFSRVTAFSDVASSVVVTRRFFSTQNYKNIYNNKQTNERQKNKTQMSVYKPYDEVFVLLVFGVKCFRTKNEFWQNILCFINFLPILHNSWKSLTSKKRTQKCVVF